MQFHRFISRFLVLALTLGMACFAQSGLADEIIIGGQCDRTGPTKFVGTIICPGTTDYIEYVNANGGVEGHTLRYMEVEHAYKVDRGIEAYERIKREGGVATMDYGTPIVYALAPRHMEDKIPGITPGFGRADAADGERFPYIFPVAASYWSQGSAAMQFLKDKGANKGSKIAYIYYDNAAGQEPLPIFREICKLEGYKCREFAIPPPGVEMAASVLDITRRFRADYVVSHLFGKAPAISIKEFRKNGYDLNKIISLVWGAGENDMIAAGCADGNADGYLAMHFAGVGREFPVIQEIMKTVYQDRGKDVPDIVGQVYYNRGVFNAAIMVEGVRNAIKNHGMPVTGEKVKLGYEEIKDFTLGGFLPPLNVTAQDHEGGGWVQIYETKGCDLVKNTDWFQGYRDIVMAEIKKAGEKE
jgi:branched-chain amino acid transport system substrate-binding protein